MEPSDEMLVERAKRGDANAFADLVTRHYELIHRLAFRLLGSEFEADDLAQDVCAGLALKITSFKGDARFTTWLHRVVINAGRDALRKRETRTRASESWGDVERMRRTEDAEARAELNWLMEAMGSLNQDLRETVALVIGEDMTHAEAAQSLGISPGTVSWRMNAVKKALKKQARAEDMLR